MQAVDPPGLVPGGSPPIPQAEGDLFAMRLATAFADEGAGEAPADQAAVDEAPHASGVPLAPGQLRSEAMAAALPQPSTSIAAGATRLSPVDPLPGGGDEVDDEVDDGVGELDGGERASAPPGSRDVRVLTASSDARPSSVQGDGARDQKGSFHAYSLPRDGDLTAAASPMTGRPSGADLTEPRAHASGRDASPSPADTSSGTARAVFRHAAVAPSAEEETATGPAAPIPRAEPFAAEARPVAQAGVDPPASAMVARAHTPAPGARPETPMAAAPVAQPSGAVAREDFGDAMQRGPGHEPPAGPPSPAPRLSSAPAPMLFQSGESLPGPAIAAPGTAAVASYALMGSSDRAENIGRLVQSMRVLVRDGVSEATVRLRPEHLGDVSISLRVEGRSVSAVVRAEAAGVREWLQSQHESLRQALALQGLSLDRLEVEPDGGRGGRDEHADQDDRPRRPRPRPREAHSRFEVVV